MTKVGSIVMTYGAIWVEISSESFGDCELRLSPEIALASYFSRNYVVDDEGRQTRS